VACGQQSFGAVSCATKSHPHESRKRSNFYGKFLSGKALAIACPKHDTSQDWLLRRSRAARMIRPRDVRFGSRLAAVNRQCKRPKGDRLYCPLAPPRSMWPMLLGLAVPLTRVQKHLAVTICDFFRFAVFSFLLTTLPFPRTSSNETIRQA